MRLLGDMCIANEQLKKVHRWMLEDGDKGTLVNQPFTPCRAIQIHVGTDAVESSSISCGRRRITSLNEEFQGIK